MKNPLKHIQDTKIWMKLVESVTSLQDRHQVRRLWHLLPLIRQLMSPRLSGRRFVSVNDYHVPCIRQRVEEKARAAGVVLPRFSPGDAHDSNPPPPDMASQHMRDIMMFTRRTAQQIMQELTDQGLSAPQLSDIVDLLTACPHAVRSDDPLYAILTERTADIRSGRIIHRVFRIHRTNNGFTVEMTRLPVRKADGVMLLPSGSRILGVSQRPLAAVLPLTGSSRSSDRSSEPA